MRSFIFLTILSLVFFSCKKQVLVEPTEIIQDYDGNIYKTVKIGEQHWMSENLNVSRWADGLENPYWFQSKYGKLYYPKALSNKPNGGICPKGWHVPSNTDWQKLFNFLGGDLKTVGAKLKKSGISGWSNNNSNNIGFNAIPNGYAGFEGSQLKIIEENTLASFWGMDSLSLNPNFYTYTIKGNSSEVFYDGKWNYSHVSCRCIKD